MTTTPTQPLSNSGYIYETSFNPFHNSVLLRNSLEEKLFLLDLDDLSTKLITSTSEHYVFPYFTEHGYFALFVSESSSNNGWTEVLDYRGVLVDSNKTESLANPTYGLSDKLQKKESVPFCKFSVSLNSSGQLVTIGDPTQSVDDICFGTNSTSKSQLYTFPAQQNYGPRTIYDREGNVMIVVTGSQLQWLNNSLVYIDLGTHLNPGSMDLIVNDFIGGEVKRYDNENNHLGSIYVVGQKIVSFTPQSYNKPANLHVLNGDLTIEFDSTAK